MQVNLWHHKLFHFHLSFWIWKVWKGRKKIEYVENENSFLDEIKNIFHSFWRLIIWRKNKNLIKIADTSFKLDAIHLVSTQNISYVFRDSKKCQFFGKYCARTKQIIPDLPVSLPFTFVLLNFSTIALTARLKPSPYFVVLMGRIERSANCNRYCRPTFATVRCILYSLSTKFSIQ